MINHVSYSVQILHENRIFRETERIYRDVVSFLIEVVERHFAEIDGMSSLNAKRYVECLVHGTSKRKALYPSFDKRFYKLPCYIRRSAIADAVGDVQSYHALLKNWEEEKKGRKPRLNRRPHHLPVFYRGNMFDVLTDDIVRIKLFVNNDWRWVVVYLRRSDVRYMSQFSSLSAPRLERRNHRCYLRFSTEVSSVLPDKVDRVCGVDLGLTTSAVCSILEKDGTVIARKFIDFPIEKDRMSHLLNKIRKVQRNGQHSTTRLWRLVDNYNQSISIKTAHEIVMFAKEHNAQVIVFENLDSMKKGKGSVKQRLHLWRKKDIQRRSESLAHKHGIRISRICAWNTSRLAFDGSGEVKRGKEVSSSTPYDICQFKNGKIYNCDLSASYNIGARYFIRELLKPYLETDMSDILAKVPECAARTKCTLSSLITLFAVMRDMSLV